MEWPKRARTADWENGVLALDREKQFEVPKLTAEIMERLAGYTLVGFHVKGYPVTDELLTPCGFPFSPAFQYYLQTQTEWRRYESSPG